MLRKQLRDLRINIFLEIMLTGEVSYGWMLGLTLFRIFINYLEVGNYYAVKCHYFQAVKGKPEGIKKKKRQNHRRPTSQAVMTQENDR